MIDLLTMSTLWVFGAHVLRYLVMSIYLMNILFQVLYIFDLKCFLDRIYMLTLLSNIWTYSRFCLTPIQTSDRLIIVLLLYVLLAINFVGSWQYLLPQLTINWKAYCQWKMIFHLCKYFSILFYYYIFFMHI